MVPEFQTARTTVTMPMTPEQLAPTHSHKNRGSRTQMLQENVGKPERECSNAGADYMVFIAGHRALLTKGTSDLASTSNRIVTRFPFTVFLLSDRASIGTVSSGLAIRGRADEEHVEKVVILTAVIRAQKKGTMSQSWHKQGACSSTTWPRTTRKFSRDTKQLRMDTETALTL